MNREAPDPTEQDGDFAEGRHLFCQPCDFMLGVVSLQGLPEPTLPEVAFAGRSNVGKSSLINALTGRKGLAKASGTPGRTRELNFFNLNDQIRLVDLPGYGFARASRDLVKRWQNVANLYLRGRANLKRVILLIDARHGLKAIDHEALDALDETAVSTVVVLTKADKISKSAQAKVLKETQEGLKRHVVAYPEVFLTSAEKRLGLDAVRQHIADLT